jgi:hypothetical protein
MAWQDFEFDPVEGLENTTVFESKPSSGARARQQVMTPLNQIKAFINTKVKEVSTDLATHKTEFEAVQTSLKPLRNLMGVKFNG